MSVIESIIGGISPKWAARREAWRQYGELVRSYDAGKNDRLNAGWHPAWNESAEMTDKAYRDNIRARARDLERNSDIFNGITSAFERNIVGRGITLQAKTNDEDLNKELESLWGIWCRAKNCDVNGVLYFAEIIRMAVRRKHVDGGILIAKVYTGAGVVPLQLQLIEVDELDISAVNPSGKGNTIIAGVEVNNFGKPVGYHIRAYRPDGTAGITSRYIPREDVIFYSHKTRPSQIREISPTAPTVPRIRDVNSYMEAVSVKERVAALLAVFITKLNPSGTGLGRPSSRIETMPGSAGYGGLKLTPGMVTELQPGEDIKVVAPAGQGGSAEAFIRIQQRISGAGQGLSYETISREMSQVNDSSARQGLIEDELTYSIEQDALIEHVLREIYESFVISAVLAGAVKIPQFWENKHKYLTHEWVPQGHKWIDPKKEADANKIAIESGQRTLAQITAENGRDWKDQIDEIAQINEYAQQKGVHLSTSASVPVSSSGGVTKKPLPS
jgi:lambda family phage portal protein